MISAGQISYGITKAGSYKRQPSFMTLLHWKLLLEAGSALPATAMCVLVIRCPFNVQEADDIITDLQKDIFEGQGIAGEWGITCLGLVGDTYQDDPKFMKLFVAMVERWVKHQFGRNLVSCQHCNSHLILFQ